jgi:hypothetical protein
MAEPLPALGVQVPQPTATGATAINPFQAGVDIFRMRQLANENQNFQLQQWANRGMAEIMSRHAGDEEGGLREILSSPFAPYGSKFAAEVRASNQSLATTGKTLAETGRLNFETNDTAMHSMVKYLGPMYDAILNNRPEAEIRALGNTAIQSTLSSVAGMTKEQQQNAITGMQSIIDGINSNLPADNPAMARQMRLSRIGNLIPGSGMDAAGMDRILHKPTTIETPQGVFFGTYDAGGNFAPQANPLYPGGLPGFIPKGFAPSIGASGGALYPGTNPFGVPQAPTGAPAPAPAPGPAPASTAAPAPTVSPTPATTAAPAPSTTSAPVELAGDGTPLWSPEVMARNPPQGNLDASGTEWHWQGGKTQEAAVQDRAKTFNDKEGPRFGDAQAAMKQFAAMDASLDRLQGTLLQTGTGIEERAAAVKAVNTGVDLFNSTFHTSIPKFDGQTMAAYDSFVKEMTTAQFNVLATQFGHQREAGTVVATAGKAVPGIENTPMGNKLVLEELKSGTQRYQDYYKFTTKWMQTHQGDPQGADVEFDKLHKPEQYENEVLNKFGLTREGFKDQGAIDYAYSRNWIDDKIHEQATRQLQARQAQQSGRPISP